MSEEWRDIKGFEGRYQVSNKGNVRRIEKCKNGEVVYHQKKNVLEKATGYMRSMLVLENGKKQAKNIHRMVAESFLPNPNNKPCVDHIDTNRQNNDVSNLRWVTFKENSNNELTIKNSEHCRNIWENIKRVHTNLPLNERKFFHPVVSVSLYNGEVKVYKDRMSAAKSLSLSPSNIWSCISGRRKTCGGYKWYYLKDYKSSEYVERLQ